uniref:KIAA0513 n=1 Tax=Scleropages formosus TaxID=113540 RepID=A0A8C9TZ27_SCLFO
MEGEGVAVGNLIDFDVSPSVGGTAPSADPHDAARYASDLFAGQPLLPEPIIPCGAWTDAQSSAPPCGNDSEATESADSENDETNSPSHTWSSSRRSSSSSGHSAEEVAPEVAECREFMKNYVEKMFYGKEEFEQEEKARFGELCSGENNKGREWFAKYVSAQRCNSKCVSEQTFYRLVQAFAVVLSFPSTCRSQLSPTELLERPTSSIDSYLRSANSWLSGKKDMAERLLKNTSAKTDVKGFFGGLESKLRGPSVNKTEDTESPVEGKPKTPVSPESPEGKKGEKIYLYTHLKQQPIWHTLRFWNAAFFDAVHCERKKRSPTTRRTAEDDTQEREKWCHMTQEERDDSSRFNENITFGQLGTFTHNMLAFGLSKKLCNDFLKKQAVIGNLNEEQYKLLSDHIEEMAVE